MKQILIFLVLMTIGCNDAMKYPLVVEKVVLTRNSTKGKYFVSLKKVDIDGDGGYFYTDNLYQVGDTLK